MNIQWIQQHLCGRTFTARQTRTLTALCWLGIAVWANSSANVYGQLAGRTAKPSRTATASSKAGSLFSHGDQAFRVVRAEDYADGTIVDQPISGGLAPMESYAETFPMDGGGHSMGSGACASGNCARSCNSCGGYAGSSAGYLGGASCPQCESYWYGSIDILSMGREGDRRFSVSSNFLMSGFDDEWAPRITIGMVPDCVHGYELSFTGSFQWDRQGVLVDPAGGIGTLLVPVAPVQSSDLSAFQNATAKAQFYTSEYWSLEASNTMVGWDVAKLLCGFRYIDYDEKFSVFSQNATEVGFLGTDLDNQMLGFQVGMDLLYPICERTYTDLRARAGAYANFIDLDLRVVNDGALTALLVDDSIELAGQFELGSGIRHQFSQCFSIRAGFEVWYLTGIASAKDQLRNGILGNRSVQAEDDFWITGWNLGAEFRY
jgi:hypothetical protein